MFIYSYANRLSTSASASYLTNPQGRQGQHGPPTVPRVHSAGSERKAVLHMAPDFMGQIRLPGIESSDISQKNTQKNTPLTILP